MKVSLGTLNTDVVISEGVLDEDKVVIPDPAPRTLLTTIRPIHREAIRRIVSGQTVSAAARDVGLSRSYLAALKNQDPLFKSELEKAMLNKEADVLKRIQLTSYEALDVVRELMREGKSENIRLQAAQTILDRAGFSKLEKRVSVTADAETVIRELNRRKGELSSTITVATEMVRDITDGETGQDS